MSNAILELKGSFEQKNNPSRPGAVALPKDSEISVDKISNLLNELNHLLNFWEKEAYVDGALINIRYRRLVAKSNRVARLFTHGNLLANDLIVGARFVGGANNSKKHLITYHVSIGTLEKTIAELSIAQNILFKEFNGIITDEFFNDGSELFKCWKNIDFENYGLSKTAFQQITRDVYFVEKFLKPEIEIDFSKRAIINFFETNIPIEKVLERLGITLYQEKVLDKTTVLLDEKEVALVMGEIPYLIAMTVEDLSQLSPSDFISVHQGDKKTIPAPSNEPTIGVIDTLFDPDVYFAEWVENHLEVDERFLIGLLSNNAKHGTAVSSIIVDGPTLNPNLDDGCGRFRVRHFGVATAGGFSSFEIAKKIRQIVKSNLDIKVWNLSLGANSEINPNFISPVAFVLDELQHMHDIIFVVAGTNNNESRPKKIGAPADSINSLVVNSVSFDQKSANYTREGIVLSFFVKPDISYYGGCSDKGDSINVCEPNGLWQRTGTSYAAPWIARKLAYLIHYMGLTREVAKALIIDSAIGWDGDVKNATELAYIGHGIVPIKIEDIIQSNPDEIKFVVSGKSERWETYNHRFPIPVTNDKHPFRTKATMCYFPKVNRNQGVDYTNTELNIKFGRIDAKGKIKDIKKNEIDDGGILFEHEARAQFRKWDNVKHISEGFNEKAREKKAYERKLWGMRITTTERLRPRDGEDIPFGIVVTLQELNGINRIQEFIYRCTLNGWLVNEISIENKVELHNAFQQEIEWEE